jgi:hypothetical protein
LNLPRGIGKPGAVGAALNILGAGRTELIIVVFRGEDSLACNGQCNTAHINCNPPAAPLFGNVGRCTRATRGIQYEVTWVNSHLHAPLNDRGGRLHCIDLGVRPALNPANVSPEIRELKDWEVSDESHVIQGLWACLNPLTTAQTRHPFKTGFPVLRRARLEASAREVVRHRRELPEPL